jgi:chromosome condensin MukBEF ATPase and DNA-binding subunit MukB
MTEDLTTRILIQIRDEIVKTNERLDATRLELSERLDATRLELSERLDATNQRLDATNQRLDRHEQILVQLVRGQDRHEQAIAKLIGEVQSLGTRFDNFLTGPHRQSHEEIQEQLLTLHVRVDRIEQRLGAGG